MPSLSYLTTLLLLPAATLAVNFDCSNIVVEDESFSFKTLGGPKSVNYQRHTPPTITNTTFTIDLCRPLKKPKNEPSEEYCVTGTRVCGVQRGYGNGEVQEVIPIAGEYLGNGGRLDAHFERMANGSSHLDVDRDGVRVKLHGGKYDGKEQKAIIELVCDMDMEGTEGFDTDEPKMMDVRSYGEMKTRAESEEGDGDGDDGEKLPDLDKGKALQFLSYEAEKKVHVLRLIWKTKHACAGEASKAPSKGKHGWGFFTWVLIIVFLLAASYIIFGSWLNYNRYGARGWDLIPHGDSIRDLPYIVKDWVSSMTDKIRGGGTRGGYSAV